MASSLEMTEATATSPALTDFTVKRKSPPCSLSCRRTVSACGACAWIKTAQQILNEEQLPQNRALVVLADVMGVLGNRRSERLGVGRNLGNVGAGGRRP
jgi:hypothetical protein